MDFKYLMSQFGNKKDVASKQDPFNQFKRQINNLIDRAFTGYTLPEFGHNYLNIDVCDKGKELEIKVEVPGVADEDISVSVQENNLIISGEKRAESKEKQNNYYLLERTYGSFMRFIPLPFRVKNDKVEAELDKGVLTIRILKPKEVQSRLQPVKIKKSKPV